MQLIRAFISDGSLRRTLHDERSSFVPGQRVIWNYRPQRPRHRPYAVAAEVVQTGNLRVRIRVYIANGASMLRWVHPKNLRTRAPDEPAAPYPSHV
jgi:hypothetical protein